MNLEKLKQHECRFCAKLIGNKCKLQKNECRYQSMRGRMQKILPDRWELHPDIVEAMPETTELKKVIPTRPESEGKLYEEGVRLGLIAINGRSDFHLGWRFCYDWIAEAMQPETTELKDQMFPSSEVIEANGIEGGLRDNELQLFWEGATWLKGYLQKQMKTSARPAGGEKK